MATFQSEFATSATNFDTLEGRIQEIKRIMFNLDSPPPTRILSALGHPGYGSPYAGRILNIWTSNIEFDLHDIIYGQRGSL